MRSGLTTRATTTNRILKRSIRARRHRSARRGQQVRRPDGAAAAIEAIESFVKDDTFPLEHFGQRWAAGSLLNELNAAERNCASAAAELAACRERLRQARADVSDSTFDHRWGADSAER